MLLLFLVCVYQWLCVWVWQITEFQASSGLVDVCGEHTDTYFLGKTWCGSQGRARGFIVIYCTVNKRAVCCEESCILGPTSPPSSRSTIQTVTKNLYLYNNVIMYAITVVTHLKTKHPVYIPVVNLWKHLKFMPFAIRDKLIHSDFPPKGHGNVLFQLFFNVVLFCLGPQCLKNQDASRCRCESLAPTSIFQGNNWGVCL